MTVYTYTTVYKEERMTIYLLEEVRDHMPDGVSKRECKLALSTETNQGGAIHRYLTHQ